MDSNKKNDTDPEEEEITIIKDKKEVMSDLERANEYKNKGDYENAISYYSMFLSFNPNNCEAWENKGFVLSLIDKYEEAIKCFDKALELDPPIPELILLNKGNSLINLKKNKEAILCFNSALDIDPNLSHAWYSKAIAYLNLDMPERALSCCDKTLKIDPKHAQAQLQKKELLEIVKEQKVS